MSSCSVSGAFDPWPDSGAVSWCGSSPSSSHCSSGSSGSGSLEQLLEPAEVLDQLLLHLRRPQRRRGVQQREDEDRAAAERVHLRHAADPGDPGRVVGDQLRGEVAERGDDPRLDQLDLAPQIGLAGLDLDRLRIAVARGPALEDVGDEDLLAIQADALQQLVEQPAGAADERQALAILVRAREPRRRTSGRRSRRPPRRRPSSASRRAAHFVHAGRLAVDLDQLLAAGIGLARGRLLHPARPRPARLLAHAPGPCLPRRFAMPSFQRVRAPSRLVPRLSSIRRRWFGVGWRLRPKLENRRSAPAVPQRGHSALSVPLSTRDSNRSPH